MQLFRFCRSNSNITFVVLAKNQVVAELEFNHYCSKHQLTYNDYQLIICGKVDTNIFVVGK